MTRLPCSKAIRSRTEKQFINRIANGSEDILQQFLDLLARTGMDYCVIGGLAVNAYAEPVVSLDLDIVIASEGIDQLIAEVGDQFSVRRFEHRVNLNSAKSNLRIQLQTDLRYQSFHFIEKAQLKQVMGYEMKVAALEDVLLGKVWAYSDSERRPSKRQKDLADIYRLVEAYPHLHKLIPESIKLEGI